MKRFFPSLSLGVLFAVLALVVPSYAQAPTPTPFPLTGIFNNKGELGIESVRSVALSQSTATPFYKSNGLETRFYEGDFKAAADTTKLALLSDDGTSVWIDGQQILNRAGQGQGFENFDATFYLLPKTFIKDRLYHLRLQYTNTIHSNDADVDGISLWAYDGGGSIVVPPPPPPAPPDLAIRALDEDASAYLGLGQRDASGATQTKTGLTVPGTALSFIVKVRNTSGAAQSLKLSAPTDADNWTTRLYDGLLADETKNITTAALQGGWPLELANGAEREVRVEVAPGATAGVARLVPITVALASDANSKDVARIEATMQKIAKIQWSRDGQLWSDFSPSSPPEIERFATIGVRAIKSASNMPWAKPKNREPKWTWQGGNAEGETVWLQGKNLTSLLGENVVAEFGNSVVKAIRVLPSYDVTIRCNRDNVLAGAGPTALKTTTFSVFVTDDEDGTPQVGVKVRLRALTASGAASGELGSPGTVDDVLTTDAGGQAQILWTSDASVGEVRFEAVPLDEQGRVRGAGHSIWIQTNASYTRLKIGAWTQTGGVWSRPITASVWFMGQKVAGRAVTLASQVKDTETGLPLSGWQSAAPLDATTGTTDANGAFTTVQRWNPVEAGAWPHDYDVSASAS